MEEKISLLFQPGNFRRDGFKWIAVHEGKTVGLCQRRFCDICNQSEREKLRDFRGGELEVVLTEHRWPSFWEERLFYYGHLASVPTKEEAEVDEGGEFDISGMNAVVYNTGQGAVLVDPGYMGFGDEKMVFRQFIAGKRITAIIVTHGHQDHWNHLRETRSPVFMSQLTFRLASRHAFLGKDRELVRVLRTAKMMITGQPVILDQLPVSIDTILLPHSIPDTTGLIIRGEKRRIVHLGDFKLVGMAAKQKAEIVASLHKIAEDGVDLLALNIINAHVDGSTPMEALVIDHLTNVLARTPKRVIISCFSTNLARIARIEEIAQILGRPVAFYGAGMRHAREILEIKTENGKADPDKAVIFVTGCQAEEYSVLWRLSQGQSAFLREGAFLKLRPDDTLVFSSRCIPGNEGLLRQLISSLKPQVGKVIVSKGDPEQIGLQDSGIEEGVTHVSGHASKEDIRLVLEILKPKKVLAWPQISPQIEHFRQIAEPLGIEILPENERVIEV